MKISDVKTFQDLLLLFHICKSQDSPHHIVTYINGNLESIIEVRDNSVVQFNTVTLNFNLLGFDKDESERDYSFMIMKDVTNEDLVNAEKKPCYHKVNGNCILNNLQCGYPKCQEM